MTFDIKDFAVSYGKHVAEREADGIPPLPLSTEEVKIVAQALLIPKLDPGLLKVHGCADTVSSLRALLEKRVPPGVYPASHVKAEFLGNLALGSLESTHLDAGDACRLLGRMLGGRAVSCLIEVIGKNGPHAAAAREALENMILVSGTDFDTLVALAKKENNHASMLLKSWGEARWFANLPAVPAVQKRTVVRLSGEINTDFFSPAQEAGTRDDIPLHALKILSTSPDDKEFIERVGILKAGGGSLLCAGDVVGTGSSRKSASNSLIWWIGEEIPGVPNKKRGGVVLASKIAPIFFNTLRGCGAVPVRCSTGNMKEGDEVTIDLNAGKVMRPDGTVLTEFSVEPASILDEARAGGRNNLIIGRKLTGRAREACRSLGIDPAEPALAIPEPPRHAPDQKYSLAQKLVGAASGRDGVLPGEYCEPKAHLVFSQDTTGIMTQQELQELATLKFSAPTIQSFCHTAAGPRSKDSKMQSELGTFIRDLNGIDLRPGDGVIHTNGNRFLLPYFVGTGGDSHTRFPIGISFPAGSDLVAFAASQGYFPLDMPESVLVRFSGEAQPGITARDMVNAIPFTALQTGKLNLEKGDAKKNVFADRILEMKGLEGLTVEMAFKLTDTSAERSAAASTFAFDRERVTACVENNLRFLENNFSKRDPSPVVKELIARSREWLGNPDLLEADDDAPYADVIDVNLNKIGEPLLAAPNDPDKIVTLSDAAGTPVAEVFIGSCMTDITDFRIAAAILDGEKIPHTMKFWTVPPDRESYSQLAKEGLLSRLMELGANVHVPGCSLCMGNQAQVATGCTTFSTSTRNFENRMGLGAQVYLGSSAVASVAALLNRIPTLEEYLDIFNRKVAPKIKELTGPLLFS
jgi:aconitate hydratase 2 / 2-methylisocitrate dehydratase